MDNHIGPVRKAGELRARRASRPRGAELVVGEKAERGGTVVVDPKAIRPAWMVERDSPDHGGPDPHLRFLNMHRVDLRGDRVEAYGEVHAVEEHGVPHSLKSVGREG